MIYISSTIPKYYCNNIVISLFCGDIFIINSYYCSIMMQLFAKINKIAINSQCQQCISITKQNFLFNARKQISPFLRICILKLIFLFCEYHNLLPFLNVCSHNESLSIMMHEVFFHQSFFVLAATPEGKCSALGCEQLRKVWLGSLPFLNLRILESDWLLLLFILIAVVNTSNPSNEAELQLYRVLQRASLLAYYDTLLEMGKFLTLTSPDFYL